VRHGGATRGVQGSAPGADREQGAGGREAEARDGWKAVGVPFEGAQTTGVMKMRLFWAKHLYDSGYTKNIIFSGSSVYSPYVEGVVMKLMADSLGIPSQNTFSETKAEHSTENVYYGYLMAKKLGFKKIALATDPYQAGLLRSFIRKYCPGMKVVPIIYGTLNLDEKQLPKIDSSLAYVSPFVSITKRESFWQRMRGTMGSKVKQEAKTCLPVTAPPF
jgi:hypothetical protein